MEFANQVYINTFSVILIITTLSSLYRPLFKKNSFSSPDEVLFFLFAVSIGTILILDIVLWLVEGYPNLLSRRAYIVSYVIYFSLHLIPPSIFIMYTDYILFGSMKRIRRILNIMIPANILVILISATTPWTEILFTINSENSYVRGVGFPVFAFVILAATLFSVVLMASGRKKRSHRVIFTLMLFPVMVTIAGLLQSLYFGLAITWSTPVIFIVAAAFNIQKAQIHTDHLTGLMNRRSFEEEFLQYLRKNSKRKSFGGILLDLNNFKLINDTWGHRMGDKALMEAADILRSVVEEEDTVARVGGDEFVILMPDGSPDRLKQKIDKINYVTSTLRKNEDHPYTLTFSIGSGTYDTEDSSMDGEKFLNQLDALMYKNKAHSRQ